MSSSTYNVNSIQTDTSPTLYSGKYKGKSYLSVVYSDIRYCDWVVHIDGAKGDMLKFQKWLMERCNAQRASEARAE